MKTMKLVNIRSNNVSNTDFVTTVINLSINNSTLNKEKYQYISCGIHPWSINKNNSKELFSTFKKNIESNNIFLIGEIGIDKSEKRKESLSEQLKVFELQLHVAINENKPILIHCVKGFNEIFTILKKLKFQNPIVFHNFNSSFEIYLETLKFNSYYSLGANLFNNSTLLSFLKLIPREKIFFETDESQQNIREMYEKYCELVKFNYNELVLIINQNFIKLCKFNNFVN